MSLLETVELAGAPANGGAQLATTLVSRVNSAVDVETQTVSALEILDAIRAGNWRREIEQIRAVYHGNGKDAADTLKKRLPGILWSGTFYRRAEEALKDRNGHLCLDIDKVGQEALDDLRRRIDADKHTLASFVSPTGTGLKVLVRIPLDRSHRDGFVAAREHFRAAHGVDLDDKPTNVASLCFVSWDPYLYVNHDAVPLMVAENHAEQAIQQDGPPDDESARSDLHAELERQHGPRYLWKEDLQTKQFVPRVVNGHHFAALYARGREILYEPTTGRFYMYDESTGLWSSRSPHTIKVDMASLLLEVTRADGCENLAMRNQNDNVLTGWLNYLRGIVEEPNAFGDRPAGRVHCRNGMLDVGTGTLMEFSPDDYSRNQAPINYDPRAACPRFVELLLTPALDADDIRLVQLYAGSCLLGRNLGQRILLFLGTAGGGKSTLVSVIELVVGLPNVAQLRTELLAERFETNRFIGKTLLVGKDVPGNFLQTKGAHVVKALVGGDVMETERKNGNDTAQIRGEYHVIITSNCRLRVKLDGDATAWERRLLVVEYDRPKPAQAISDLAQSLMNEEGPGILNWMIEGARALLDNDFRYDQTPRQKQRLDSLLRESDSIRSFVRECVTQTAGHDATTEELRQGYQTYCDLMGWTPLALRQIENQLPDALMDEHRIGKRNDIQRHGKNARGYGNCRVAIPTRADDDTA
jgi:putative DNA primase/helicase